VSRNQSVSHWGSVKYVHGRLLDIIIFPVSYLDYEVLFLIIAAETVKVLFTSELDV
jgi:hypothetical protein